MTNDHRTIVGDEPHIEFGSADVNRQSGRQTPRPRHALVRMSVVSRLRDGACGP